MIIYICNCYGLFIFGIKGIMLLYLKILIVMYKCINFNEIGNFVIKLNNFEELKFRLEKLK